MTATTRAPLPRTLPEARRQFVKHRSPRILMACLALAVLVRVFVGDFTWWNVVPFVAVVAVQPFLEWTLHVEWSHFLIHTDYKPKTRPYRHLYDNHRWHHYRNEHYWFGITSTIGDQVLRTAPGRDEVPVSATAKSLPGL